MKQLCGLVLVAVLAALVSEDGRAASWCGTVSDTDRPALVAGSPIRIVYAHAVDSPDRSADVAPVIAGDVEAITSWWTREDSCRTPRFDLAAFPCGAQADIRRLQVPRPAAELATSPSAYAALFSTLLAWPLPSRTKYLVYYDGPGEPNACGRGGGSAAGFGIAVVFVGACNGATTASTAAHELLHAFGAVPAGALPGACPGNAVHVCDSTGDVMYPYAQPAPITSLVLDVGRNDYYGHGQSWWDAQQSPWLHRLDLSYPLDLQLKGPGRVTSDVPGVDCATSCRTDWSPGSRAILTAIPADGFRFVRWEGQHCRSWADAPCDLSFTAPQQAVAVFAPKRFRVSVAVTGKGQVTSEPYGIACPRRCTTALESYEPAELIAKPARGWKFRRWTGACVGSKPVCDLTMNRASQARAVFVRRR
jgi:hypothetical protein